jgi:hypothetical protein
MLDCTHILEIVPSPTQVTQTTVQLNYPKMFGTEIINFGLYTHCIQEIFLSPTQGTQTTVQLYSPQIFGKKTAV